MGPKGRIHTLNETKLETALGPKTTVFTVLNYTQWKEYEHGGEVGISYMLVSLN